MKRVLLATLLMLSPLVAMASDISPLSQNYYNKAITLYNAGDISQAKDYMLKVLEAEPNFADVHFNLGIMYKNAKIYEKAVSYLQKAIVLNNNDNEAKYHIAYCLNELKKTDDAIYYLVSIPTKDTNYPKAYNLLSQIAPDKYPQTTPSQQINKNINFVNLEKKNDIKLLDDKKLQKQIEQQEAVINKQKSKIQDLNSRLQQQLSNAHIYQNKINTLEITLKQQADNFAIQKKQIEEQFAQKIANPQLHGTKEIEYIQILQSKDNELAQKNTLLSQQSNQIAQLNTQIKDLQVICHQQINKIEELKNTTLSNIQTQEKPNIAVFKDEITTLKNQKMELNRTIAQLKEQIKIQEDNNNILLNKIKIFENTIQNQAIQLAKQTTQVQPQTNMVLETANANLKQEINSKNILIQMQNEEISQLKIQIEKLKNTIAQQQEFEIKNIAQVIKPIKNEYFGIIHTFAAPTGITRDSNNNTFVASFAENSIYKITPQNKISLFLKHQQINGPIGLACDSKNNIYVANYNNNTILKITPNAEINVFAKDIERPYYLTIANDILYVSEQATNTVIKYNLNK